MRIFRRLGGASAPLILAIVLGTACQSVAVPSGAALPLSTATMSADEMPRVNALDLKKHIDRGEPILIVDTRAPASFAKEHVTGAVNVPYGAEGQDFSQLPKDRFIALYCT